MEYIESSLIEKAESHKVGTKITFSPTQTPLQPRRSESNRLSILDQTQSDDVLNSTLMQTNHQPSQKSVIKVYMKNELERNESEMEYYENIVNELATRCEDLTAEKSNLEVDLKLYMEEKERLQDDALTLKQHIEALTEEYQRESELSKVAWDTHKQTLLKQIETMTEQLQQTTDANIANEERIRDLTDLIARNDEEAQDSVQRLDRVHEELEESLQKAAELEQEIDEMRERNEELSQQINKFQSKEAETETQLAQQLRDQVESMDAVRATNAGLIDQLKNKRAYIKELSNVSLLLLSLLLPPCRFLVLSLTRFFHFEYISFSLCKQYSM